MPRYLLTSLLLALGLSACAPGASKSIPAVVESDSARQAAADAARSGDSPDKALSKGEAAEEPK
jgi:hypothetical protein